MKKVEKRFDSIRVRILDETPQKVSSLCRGLQSFTKNKLRMDFHINCSCAALAGLFHLLRSTFQTIPESDERNLQTREDDVANDAQQSIRARGYTIYVHVYLSESGAKRQEQNLRSTIRRSAPLSSETRKVRK